MRALAYLEWWYLRNNVRAIRHSPGRLALWSLYALTIVLLSAMRLAHAPAHERTALGVAHGSALAVAGMFFVFNGLAIATGARGRFGAFRSSAEAVLMTNAGLQPRTIAVWLQLRKIVLGSTRLMGSILYAFVLIAPVHAGARATAGAFFATALTLAVPLSAGLPAFLLARGRAQIPVLLFGWAMAALGIIYAVAGVAGPRVWAPILRTTHIDIASLVRTTLLARPLAFVVPLVLFATFVLVVALRGNDALPEIYAASIKTLARRERLRRGGKPSELAPNAKIRRARIPAGARALVWKEWVALRRSPAGLAIWLGSVAVWSACGWGAAAVAIRFDDATTLATFAISVGLVLLFWAPFTAASGLAAELTKPLFWLASGSLRTRIAAWALARAWRGALAIGCGTVAAALMLGRPLLAALCLPFAALVYWSLNALGIGFFAVFPDPVDARGPTALLRLVASLAYIAPAIIVAYIAGLLHSGDLGVAAAFALALGLQGWLVVELVALRFTEYGASLATISRAT